MDLRTSYLGMDLPHPFIAGASPLTYNTDTVLKLEDAGAAAVVLHSLFEEQIVRDRHSPPKMQQGPDRMHLGVYDRSAKFPLQPEAYLAHLQGLKERVGIPVIGSLNGVEPGSWIKFAAEMQKAGADAIELNLYFIPRADELTSGEIEGEVCAIVRAVREQSPIPLAVKISPSFTGLPKFVQNLEEAGASAIVLFNGFFQPEIDIEKLSYRPVLRLSQSSDLLVRTRWAATLFGRTHLDISITGGVHTSKDAVKACLSGAKTVQMVSALLRHGPDYLAEIIEDFNYWLEGHGFESMEQLRGMLSFTHVDARASYMETIQNWKTAE